MSEQSTRWLDPEQLAEGGRGHPGGADSPSPARPVAAPDQSCGQCGYLSSGDSRFCQSCGESLNPAERS